MTRLFVEYTDYELNPPLDISPFKVNCWLKPIIVCAREGQKKRLLNLVDSKILKANVVGWWDLSGIAIDSLLEYDAVFVLDPERIGVPAAKEQWERIIECLK